MDNGFIENGYRPQTEVKDTLSPEVFQKPTAEDRIHFYKSEGCAIPELQQAIQSTILVSESTDHPGGSGVIVTHEGKKYVITATHVIGDLLAGEHGKDQVKFHYRDTNGAIREGVMTKNNMLYDSTTARERGLQATDVAIFTFDGDNQGVEVSDHEVSTEQGEPAVVIGFPGEHQDGWKTSTKPLLSVGEMFKDKPKEMTPYMRELMEKHMQETGEKMGVNLNVYFTGRVLPGNSGGPLVDTKGKPLGVCHGPRGTFGKEDGTERFSDFRPILKTISATVGT